jgi:hypothetical protein
VQWIVETRSADKATRNAGGSVFKCQEWIANVCHSVRFDAFPASVYDEVFSGYQPGKMDKFFRDKHFEDHLCPRPQGNWIELGKVDNPDLLFIPVKDPFSGPPTCHWGPVGLVIARYTSFSILVG